MTQCLVRIMCCIQIYIVNLFHPETVNFQVTYVKDLNCLIAIQE